MPRLLIICEYPTLLGGERSMLSTLSAVQAAGYDVHVAAPPVGPLADALNGHGVPVLGMETHDAAGVRRPLADWRSDLARRVDALRPDLVHANSLSMARASGPVLAAAGVPCLGHLRDIVKLSNQAIDDLNFHRRLIAVSRATRDFHVVQGIAAKDCVVVYNGVDLDTFQPHNGTGYLHRELELPADARFVATIGQIGVRKGTDVALAAAWHVAAEIADVHWLVVGERTSEKRESTQFEQLVRDFAEEPPLAGRVHFLGTRDDVPRLLCECDLLVHAARQEPLGRVLLEAAACGLAVVATEVGGTREIFPAESDGAVLVRADDRGALASAVVELLGDSTRRTSLGAAARRRAVAAFDARDAATRLIDQYRATLSLPCPPQ